MRKSKDGSSYILPACHPTYGVAARVDDIEGVLRLECAACRNFVVEYQIIGRKVRENSASNTALSP